MPDVQAQGIISLTIKFDALNTFSIDNRDLLRLSWIEDIYFFSSVGKIVLFDRFNLRERAPLTGDETLIITYGRTGTIQKEFSLIRISKIESVTEFQQAHTSVIELYFVDQYYQNLTMKKFSKAWMNARTHDIVSDITRNLLQIASPSVNIEPSSTIFDSFCMPYWTPADALRWLGARSKGTKGKSNYGYLFFSNSKNYINFVTLDSLLNSSDIDPIEYVLETTDFTYQNRILSWKVIGVDNMSIRELGGGRLLGFDSLTKTFLGLEQDEAFVYSKAIKEITTLGKQSLFNGTTIDNDPTKFNYAYSLEGENDKQILTNLFYNNFILRYSLQNMIKVTMLGDSTRYAGQKITVNWPSMDPSEIFSTMDSGLYLIKAIHHSFAPMSTPVYTQSLTLLKNAYNNDQYVDNTQTDGLIGNFSLGLFA